MSSDCLFCRIASGKMSTELLYADDEVLAFRDINPQAPNHLLVIPREHISTINEASSEHASVLGKMTLVAAQLAKQQGFDDAGYRLVMNCNRDGGQTVYHIHMHLLAGRRMSWSPG